MEGNSSICIAIPSEIVKNLNLTQDSLLYIELVDDLIVMKKHDPKLTKTEKIKSKTINEMESEDNSQKVSEIKQNSETTSETKDKEYNPLDDVF